MKKFFMLLSVAIIIAIIVYCSTNAKGETVGGEISFTRTYRIVKILNYQDATDEYTYVILDKYQEFNPFIVKFKKDLASSFVENTFYEFTFHGSYQKNFDYSNIRSLFENFSVIEIKQTEKTGLEQIQESI